MASLRHVRVFTAGFATIRGYVRRRKSAFLRWHRSQQRCIRNSMSNIVWMMIGIAVGGGARWLLLRASAARTADRLRNAEAQVAATPKDLANERAGGSQLRIE